MYSTAGLPVLAALTALNNRWTRQRVPRPAEVSRFISSKAPGQYEPDHRTRCHAKPRLRLPPRAGLRHVVRSGHEGTGADFEATTNRRPSALLGWTTLQGTGVCLPPDRTGGSLVGGDSRSWARSRRGAHSGCPIGPLCRANHTRIGWAKPGHKGPFGVGTPHRLVRIGEQHGMAVPSGRPRMAGSFPAE